MITQDINVCIKDLKNEDGVYSIKKGKSCLFMSDIDTLDNQLHKTPLYVMLTDDFKAVPILIGTCSVCIHQSCPY